MSQEAVRREVKEESGLNFEPEALLCVECHAHSWVRFTLGGRIVGGALKTVAEADRESLQAGWQPAEKKELLHTVSPNNTRHLAAAVENTQVLTSLSRQLTWAQYMDTDCKIQMPSYHQDTVENFW